MPSHDAWRRSHHQTGLKDSLLEGRRRLFPPRLRLVLIGAASLAVSGCATQQQYVRSVTYEYTDQSRSAAERNAHQDIWDDCYFSGAQYPWLLGRPKIVSEDGATGRRFRATQSFYCVGTRGEA